MGCVSDRLKSGDYVIIGYTPKQKKKEIDNYQGERGNAYIHGINKKYPKKLNGGRHNQEEKIGN